MGAKACLILSILLLSYILIPADVTAREMLQEPQTAGELKSDIDASSTTHEGPKQGSAAAGSRKGSPYLKPGCRNRLGCREGGPPGHIITPIKPVPAPKGKPYNRPRVPYKPPGYPYRRPRVPYKPPGYPYRRPCKSKYHCRPPAP